MFLFRGIRHSLKCVSKLAFCLPVGRALGGRHEQGPIMGVGSPRSVDEGTSRANRGKK